MNADKPDTEQERMDAELYWLSSLRDGGLLTDKDDIKIRARINDLTERLRRAR